MKQAWILEHEFTFDAAHQLKGLPAGHPCGRLHGHTWTVTVGIKAHTLSDVGFVIDFGVVKEVCKALSKCYFDHSCINDTFSMNPTCENIAQFFYTSLDASLREETGYSGTFKIDSITVQETAGNRVTYREDPTDEKE